MKLRILTHLLAIAFGAALVYAFGRPCGENASASLDHPSPHQASAHRFAEDADSPSASLPHRTSNRPEAESRAVVKIPRDLADLGVEREQLEIVGVKDDLIEAKPVDGGEVMLLDSQLLNPETPVVPGSTVWCLTAPAGENDGIPAGARFLASTFEWDQPGFQAPCNLAPPPRVREGAKLVIKMSADNVVPVLGDIPIVGRLFRSKLEQSGDDAGN